MAVYSNPAEFPEIPRRDDPSNDDFLFHQGPTKGLGRIQFHDPSIAYNSTDLPNIKVFKEQVEVYKELLMTAPPDKEQIKDIDFLLIMGELFTLVPYGQLIIENAAILNIDDDIIDQIFDFIVRDFSKFALQLYSKTSSTDKQMDMALKMIRKPVVNTERFNRVWETYVYSLNGAYEMSK